MEIVFLGLSLTSSWGNGHAVTYRGLVRELQRRGNRVLFLERDVPWYAQHRDLPRPPHGRCELYLDLEELRTRFADEIRAADLVVVGSYVPEGVAVGRFVLETARGVTAFYDIDTPITVAKLMAGDEEYLSREQVAGYDLYLSFTGGPLLERIERELGARATRPLYCSCDGEAYLPVATSPRWDLGYLGTYSDDRQPTLERLMLEPCRADPSLRCVVAGPQYPDGIGWPGNVERIHHLPPPEHAAFYGAQRFTLNVTRAEMIRAGHSPSVRLFEAAACAVPVISDDWEGLDTFFEPGEEILIARSSDEVRRILREVTEEERRRIGQRARQRVLGEHTAAHRAESLEGYARERVARR